MGFIHQMYQNRYIEARLSSPRQAKRGQKSRIEIMWRHECAMDIGTLLRSGKGDLSILYL
jgi:hypothetical protein